MGKSVNTTSAPRGGPPRRLRGVRGVLAGVGLVVFTLLSAVPAHARGVPIPEQGSEAAAETGTDFDWREGVPNPENYIGDPAALVELGEAWEDQECQLFDTGFMRVSADIEGWATCTAGNGLAWAGEVFDLMLNNPLTILSAAEWNVAWGLAGRWGAVMAVVAVALCGVEIIAGMISGDTRRVWKGFAFGVGAWPLTVASLMLFAWLIGVSDWLASQIMNNPVAGAGFGDGVQVVTTTAAAAGTGALAVGATTVTMMLGILKLGTPVGWVLIVGVLLGLILSVVTLIVMLTIVAYAQLVLAAFAPIALMLVGFKGTRMMSAKWVRAAVSLILIKPVIAALLALNMSLMAHGGQFEGLILGGAGMLVTLFSPVAVVKLVGFAEASFAGAKMGALAAMKAGLGVAGGAAGQVAESIKTGAGEHEEFEKGNKAAAAGSPGGATGAGDDDTTELPSLNGAKDTGASEALATDRESGETAGDDSTSAMGAAAENDLGDTAAQAGGEGDLGEEAMSGDGDWNGDDFDQDVAGWGSDDGDLDDGADPPAGATDPGNDVAGEDPGAADGFDDAPGSAAAEADRDSLPDGFGFGQDAGAAETWGAADGGDAAATESGGPSDATGGAVADTTPSGTGEGLADGGPVGGSSSASDSQGSSAADGSSSTGEQKGSRTSTAGGASRAGQAGAGQARRPQTRETGPAETPVKVSGYDISAPAGKQRPGAGTGRALPKRYGVTRQMWGERTANTAAFRANTTPAQRKEFKAARAEHLATEKSAQHKQGEQGSRRGRRSKGSN